MNQLAAAAARRSLEIRVVDARGRATRAGAEVRVYAAASKRLLAARLVDSGSGDNAQNDIPVHVGFAEAGKVDIEVMYPSAGRRLSAWLRTVTPAAQTVVVRVR